MAEILKERNGKEMGDDFYKNYVVILKPPFNEENLEHNLKANFMRSGEKILFLTVDFNPATGEFNESYKNKAVLETVKSVSKFVNDEMESIRTIRYSKTSPESGKRTHGIDASLLRSVESKWGAACNHMVKTYGLSEVSATALTKTFYLCIRTIVENQTSKNLSLDEKFNIITYSERKVN